ncbi:complement C3-like [Denticeps clupeoides]|uniref:complement C3-like n=1 Tax=Denticeps clupeoides TaxID=299321 RepID=UPI0010A3B5B7|nr:complement C3-like [Denticeps clupeoides]
MRSVWWLVVLLSPPTLSECEPLYIMLSPNILRVGSLERVFVEAQDYAGPGLDVTVMVKDYPGKKKDLVRKTVTLKATNQNQALIKITVPGGAPSFDEDTTENQYVYLQAQFPDHLLEKVVLVSFQQGYMFVQTDKMAYSPSSTVRYKIFCLSPGLQPLDKNVVVEMVSPGGTIVKQEVISVESGMGSGAYRVPEAISFGVWKIVTRFQNSLQLSFTSKFVVRGNRPQHFQVRLSPRKTFFSIDDEELRVNIMARFLFGKDVEAVGFVVFGLLTKDNKRMDLQDAPQRIEIRRGRGEAVLRREQILQTFPDVNWLLYSSIHISASVVADAGREIVEAQETVQIIASPYRIHFSGTPKFFKPGSPLSITARTKAPGLPDARQAEAQMTFQAFQTAKGSGSFLHMSADAAEVAIGEDVLVTMTRGDGPADHEMTCLILNKGQIYHVERLRGNKVFWTLQVTKDMVPSFRVVAYYHTGSSEVASNSVWVDVKDTCMGTLKLTKERHRSVSNPGSPLSLSIAGDPGAKVFLFAVDKGVGPRGDPHRLTQTKIWDAIESRDPGCTAGSGKDSMGVFYDAGLLFESSTAGGTSIRTGQDEDMDDILDILEYMNSRYQSEEAWLWDEQVLPECRYRPCNATSVSKRLFLHRSITSSEISAVSVSGSHGICVAEPLEVRTMKDFFVHLVLPYVAKRYEQLEMKAVLYNYGDEDMKVRVELTRKRDMCTAASPVDRNYQVVQVKVNSSYAVPFVIAPLELGKHTVEVKAVGYNLILYDGVRKDLYVQPEGLLRSTVVKKILLNPVKYGGIQTELVTIRWSDVVGRMLHTPASVHIRVEGQDLSRIMEKTFRGESLSAFLFQPGGNSLENMLTMTLPLTAAHYMDRTNQWDEVGMEKRAAAVEYISTGYQRQLTHLRPDGSFGVFMTRPSSTWLTAYVVKIFTLAGDVTPVETNVVCGALRWLLLKTQQTDGSFRELFPAVFALGRIWSRKDTDASLTAFVLTVMQESQHLCPGTNLVEGMRKAVQYLELRVFTLDSAYPAAMVSYALANAGRLSEDFLWKHASPKGNVWPVPGDHSFTLEATAYALLALLKTNEFEKAGAVVRWLNTEKASAGMYGSIQSTLIVYQAVAEYRTRGKELLNVSLQVTVDPGPTHRPTTWTFNRRNALVSRWTQATVAYSAVENDQKEACRHFKLNVTLEKQSEEISNPAPALSILSEGRQATTSVLEIELLTGFVVDAGDLAKLSSLEGVSVKRPDVNEASPLVFYLDTVQSFIFSSFCCFCVLYVLPSFSQASSAETHRLRLMVHKVVEVVALLQPAAVRVRRFNSAESLCVKFYHPQRGGGLLNKICHSDVCRCVEARCGVQKKRDLQQAERRDNACVPGVDYVYKVTYEQAEAVAHTDTYHMRVEQVLKEGTDSLVQGKVRLFMAHPSCRQTLDLTKGRSYLLMGHYRDLVQSNGSYLYSLSESTWIEYWPTEVERASPALKKNLADIEAFAEYIKMMGCLF